MQRKKEIDLEIQQDLPEKIESTGTKQFVDDIKLFSETKIPRNEGNLQLRGISTILPIENRQTVIVKIVPETDESIMLLGGTRLLIYKVA